MPVDRAAEHHKPVAVVAAHRRIGQPGEHRRAPLDIRQKLVGAQPFGRTLTLGSVAPTATLATDETTLFRLCTGRDPDPASFTLTGADPASYCVFD